MLKIGILGSTRGTNLLGLVAAIESKILQASIAIVISNKQDAHILARAKQFHLPYQFIDPANLSREDFDAKVTATLKHYNVQLVVLIGYMRIVSTSFVNEWNSKIINVHPSLLPLHAGKMDLAVHESVLKNKEKITGCTVHAVTAEVDAGPILVQKTCPIFNTDNAQELKARVQQLEVPALIEAINNYSS